MSSNVQSAKQQLLDDFGKVVSDAEGLAEGGRAACPATRPRKCAQPSR
jgi:hypothetical protein